MFEMPTIHVSDFAAFRDGQDELEFGSQTHLQYTRSMPSGIVIDSGIKAVLTWQARKTGSANSLTYEVSINGFLRIRETTVSSTQWITRQEVFPSDLLSNGLNSVDFVLLASDGSPGTCVISDVVLHFKREIAVP
jgi:hypothetical protein